MSTVQNNYNLLLHRHSVITTLDQSELFNISRLQAYQSLHLNWSPQVLFLNLINVGYRLTVVSSLLESLFAQIDQNHEQFYSRLKNIAFDNLRFLQGLAAHRNQHQGH